MHLRRGRRVITKDKCSSSVGVSSGPNGQLCVGTGFDGIAVLDATKSRVAERVRTGSRGGAGYMLAHGKTVYTTNVATHRRWLAAYEAAPK